MKFDVFLSHYCSITLKNLINENPKNNGLIKLLRLLLLYWNRLLSSVEHYVGKDGNGFVILQEHFVYEMLWF